LIHACQMNPWRVVAVKNLRSQQMGALIAADHSEAAAGLGLFAWGMAAGEELFGVAWGHFNGSSKDAARVCGRGLHLARWLPIADAMMTGRPIWVALGHGYAYRPAARADRITADTTFALTLEV